MTGAEPPQGHAAERTIVALDEGAAFDLAVLGAGAGGMAAAVFAALEGLKVILIERTEYLGGTTAYSGGTTWIPLTRHSAAVGAEDSRAAASRFLDLAVGNRAPKALREAFLDAGPAAVEVLETRTEMKFRARPFHPDYLSELEGATSFGRAIEPLPFEAAGLGADFALIRPPIPEFTILGGLSVDRDDIAHLLKMTRSPKSAAYAARLFARYGLERLRWPRGTRLVMGNAMIGRLLASARKLGVVIATRAEVTALRMEGGRVAGIAVEQAGVCGKIALTRGVVLAGGGFARHPGCGRLCCRRRCRSGAPRRRGIPGGCRRWRWGSGRGRRRGTTSRASGRRSRCGSGGTGRRRCSRISSSTGRSRARWRWGATGGGS
jgi:phytoene dehydrogenase-like protein